MHRADSYCADGQAVVCVSRVHLPDIIETQSLGSPSSLLKSDVNPVYRKEVPDMECHTSVFSSTGSSPGQSTRHTGKETASKTNHSLPSAWDACLPSINKQHRDGDTYPPLDLSSSTAMFHHESSSPAVSLDPQGFPLKYYGEHLGPQQQTSSLPVMGVPGTDMGGCAHPYYFNYPN